MISSEEKDRIARKLNQKFNGTGVKCPMCGNKHFIIADGYFNTTMQNDLKSITMGGPSIPSIPIICSQCGFISLHALGIIGLLPSEDKEGGKYGK